MKIGIVGHEGAKFTKDGEEKARIIIRRLLEPEDSILVSGGCHLGGIDIWAEQEADKLGRKKFIFKPKTLNWNGGYKERNLQIAESSDIVHCIVTTKYPEVYEGMKFDYCYHCHTKEHIKSGGCWTAKKCKQSEWHLIDQDLTNDKV